jgi:hypothetical protein
MKCGNAGCRRTADRLIFLFLVREMACPSCAGCTGYLSAAELPVTVVVVRIMPLGDVDRDSLELTLSVMEECELVVEWRPGLRTYSDPG